MDDRLDIQPRINEPETKRLRLDDRPNIFLVTSSGHIPAHKEVLERNSGYFRLKLLYIPEDCARLELLNIDLECLQTCVSFMYNYPITINNSKVDLLLDLAHFLEMPELCGHIFHYLEESLHPQSFYLTIVLATKYSHSRLLACCEKFTRENFNGLASTAEFVYAAKDYILSSLAHAKISSWCTVYDGILRWTYFDLENRRMYFEEMFSHIPVHELTLRYIEENIENETLIRESTSCMAKLKKSLQGFYENSEGIVLFNKDTETVKSYHPRTNRCYEVKASGGPPMQAVSEFTAVTVGDCIYILIELQSAYRLQYEDSGAVWTMTTPMNENHGFRPLATALKDSILVLGNKDAPCCIEIYDCSSTQGVWTSIGHMTRSTAACCTAAVNGQIYIIGGWNGLEVLPTVEIFDPVERLWYYAPRMATPKYDASAVSMGNKLYVIGGCAIDRLPWFMDTVDCLDTSTNFWTTIMQKPTIPGRVRAACVADGKIFIVSQDKSCSSSTIIERLDCEKRDWRFIESVKGDICVSACSSVRARKDLDFTIKVDCKEIRANRKVLAEKSDYFKAMFSHDMVENRVGFVEMKQIDPVSVRKCVDFMCSGDCPGIPKDDIENLLYAATYLQITGLIEHITEHHLLLCLLFNTFCWTRNLAERFSLRDVIDAYDAMALERFSDFVASGDFHQIEKSYLLFLLSSEKLKVDSEVEKYNAIVKWVTGDMDGRRKFFDDLFLKIDLVKIPAKHVRECISNEVLVKSSKKCCTRIMKATRERNRKYSVLLAFERNSRCLQAFCPELDKWKALQNTEKLISSYMDTFLLQLGKDIYSIDYDCSLSRLEFDEEEMKWTKLAKMNESDDYIHAVAALDGKIYAFGNTHAEKYCQETGQWTAIETLLERSDYTVATCMGDIYAIGGVHCEEDEDEWEVINTVTRYIPSADWWINVPSMNVARKNAAAAEFDRKLYVAGGYREFDDEELASVEVYSPENNVWTRFTRMHFPRASVTACIMDQKLYVVGGYQSIPNTMEYFDFEKNEWFIETMPNLLLKQKTIFSTKLKYELLV